MLEDGVAVRPGARSQHDGLGELLGREPEVGRDARQLVPAQARVDQRGRARRRRCRKNENSAPTPASSPWLPAPGNSRSTACRISWSLPLHGRLEPAAAIAMPDSTRASASAVRKSSDSMPSVRCGTRLGGRPREGHRQAVDRLPPLAAGELPVGDRGEVADTTSPMPERTIRGGEART